MKKRAVNILLFISLAFNIAFLGGGVYRFSQMRRFKPMHERIKNDKVRDFMQMRKKLGNTLESDFHKAKDDLMRAFTKPEINESELNELIDNVIEKQSLREKEIGRAMIDLRKELTDEEAEKVFSSFRNWMQPPDHSKRKNKGPRNKFRKQIKTK